MIAKVNRYVPRKPRPSIPCPHRFPSNRIDDIGFHEQ